MSGFHGIMWSLVARGEQDTARDNNVTMETAAGVDDDDDVSNLIGWIVTNRVMSL